MSKSVDLPGAVTVIAALIGAALFGVVGALLAIPTAAVDPDADPRGLGQTAGRSLASTGQSRPPLRCPARRASPHDTGQDQQAAEQLDRPRQLVEQQPREHHARDDLAAAPRTTPAGSRAGGWRRCRWCRAAPRSPRRGPAAGPTTSTVRAGVLDARRGGVHRQQPDQAERRPRTTAPTTSPPAASAIGGRPLSSSAEIDEVRRRADHRGQRPEHTDQAEVGTGEQVEHQHQAERGEAGADQRDADRDAARAAATARPRPRRGRCTR